MHRLARVPWQLLTAAIVAVTFSSSPLFAQNLLTNGGFNGSLQGWEIATDSRISLSYTQTDANSNPSSGSAEQRYNAQTVDGQSLSLISQRVQIVPGATYQFGGDLVDRIFLGKVDASAQSLPSSEVYRQFDRGLSQLEVTGQAISPPKFALWWFRRDDTLIDSGQTYALGSLTANLWVRTSASAVAPSEAVYARIILFIPAQLGFVGIFDNAFINGPNGADLPAPDSVSISFRGHTTGCGPRTISCRSGEQIDFQPVLPGYNVLSCDQFSWDFGDGARSSVQSPSHTFTGAGPFTVTLTVSPCRFGSLVAQTQFDFSSRVELVSTPKSLAQTTAGGAVTTYALRNVGGSATKIQLSQTGTFFTQTPSTFDLAAGATQTVTLTGLPMAIGIYDGRSNLSGPGLSPSSSVPVRMICSTRPGGTVDGRAVTSRVDIASSSATSAVGGSATFRNDGTAVLEGLLGADVPWIIPQSQKVTIPPGNSATVSFSIDPATRPDAGTVGSATGNLVLSYLDGGPSKQAAAHSIHPLDGSGASASTVAIVHTVTPGSAPGTIPPLAPGELAIFIPGIAHVVGTVGLFISDLTLTNLLEAGTLSNIRIWFRPNGSSSSSVTPALNLLANQPLTFSDAAQTLFNNTTAVGSAQIRGANLDSLSATASVFNASNPSGTFGTDVPSLRSDRSSGAGQTIYITGLRSNATMHSNLYLQEAAGGATSVRTQFFDLLGAPLGTRDDALSAFALVQLGSVVPVGAVSAALTPSAGSTGRLLAYATPVDRASGDTWAVTDWSKRFGYDTSQPVLVPVAAAVHGANNTYFRTDLAVMNVGTNSGSGTLRFRSRTGSSFERVINLPQQQTLSFEDVLGGLFALTTDDVGYLEFIPSSGRFVLTSRTYTTLSGQNATFGAGVPTLLAGSGLKAGERKRFGGISDASLETVQAGTPGTFRTNLGLLETSGQAATVRVTMRFTSGGQRSASQGIASADYALAPRQYLQVNGISQSILTSARNGLGDLTNLQFDFEVISGTGSVVVFTSTVDNGTGDSILRLE
ncbi:MAG: PKD domain-containing protein [Acidobacteriota bacterium]